ncbi:MAG TPA: carboxypeptidase-like regulatory domain-containing protein, partial [Puia sp.]|nr:carboxypeptidase-like regulatory domain-containing protein [Puia sp.]
MKLTTMLLLVGCLQVSAAGFAQKVSLTAENTPLKKVFKEIKRQTGYLFFYNTQLLEKAHPVSVSANGREMMDVLDECFRDQPLTYTIVNKTIVISAAPAAESPPAPQPDSTPALIKVNGKVIDTQNNTALSGANITVRGQEMGQAAGLDGTFSILVKPGATIVVSYVGYLTREIKIKDNSFLTIRLALNANKDPLTNMVVTGYQVINKESFTGNTTVISGDELKKVNPQNFLQSIQVFDPSFSIAQNNLAGSNPNVLPSINVRGSTALPSGSGDVLSRTSLSSNVNLPTFILDGFEVSLEKVYDLDINRIQSVTLLKDAAATAIYGSRAANGVLVITTKAPKEGKLQLYYNYELNVTTPDLTDYHVLNASEKLNYEQLAGLYTPVGSITQDDQDVRYYAKMKNIVSGVNTYWLSQPLTTAFGHKNSLYLEGGSNVVRYGLDLRYQTSPGVMKGSGRDRYTLGMDLSYNPSKTFLFKNVLTVNQVNASESQYGDFSQYARMNPYYPKTDSAGHILQAVDNWLIDTHQSGSAQYVTDVVLNPMYDATLHGFNKSSYLELIDAFSGEWNITRSLRLRSLLSYTKKKSTMDVFKSPLGNDFYFYPTNLLSTRGSYYYQSDDEGTFDGNLTLNYNHQVGDQYFNVLLGTNIRTYSIDQKGFTAIGFTNDRFTNIGFANSFPDQSAPVGDVSKERLFGTLLGFNYSLKNKY